MPSMPLNSFGASSNAMLQNRSFVQQSMPLSP